MDALFVVVPSLIVLVVLSKVWGRWRRARRSRYIRTYSFPTGLLDRFGAAYPALTARDRHRVARALRQFFLAYLKSGYQFVSMPSRVVDDLWHEFILYTRHYQAFCDQAFGRFLHHTPAVVLGANRQNNAGLRRVWQHACREEQIDPKHPARLPLLFALDETLSIEDGFRYRPDCSALRRDVDGSAIHCGADMASGSFDGTTDGFADSFFGDWGGGDGGDGGDGGGGGCGGD